MAKKIRLNRFSWKKKDINILGICYRCENKFEEDLGCRAFPKGIPDKILLGEFKHVKLYPKQENNIIFKPIK